MNTPRATARLQLHAGFTLDDARAQVPYYAALGISHLYLSPITTAREGSTHGYDVADHTQVSPALGGIAALRRLAEALRERQMGIIVDIVPNHMAAHPQNPWWHDVLKHGAASAHAHWFDIDWNSPSPALRGKVLLPVLGDPYDAALRGGGIRLAFDAEAARYVIEAGGTALPLAEGSLDAGALPDAVLAAHDPAEAAGRARLHALLENQHYRLSWWRCAPDQINWRRFFEVSELVGVRVELPEVFDAVHALTLRLYGAGLIDGVRIDHIDGLAQPAAYCRQLRTALLEAGAHRDAQGLQTEPYIVVEKILAPGEALPSHWHVQGTTGYDFLDQVGALLHAPAAEAPFTALWQRLAGDARPVHAQWLAARDRMLRRHFVVERRTLARVLAELAQSHTATRDWTEAAIARALYLLLRHFPRYRTYAGEHGRSPADQAACDLTLTAARADAEGDPAMQALLKELDKWLSGAPLADDDPARQRLAAHALQRFEQLTPPLAAKALEDTLFYRYAPLLSRNEVGAEPAGFALSVEDFHAACAQRARDFPQAMIATATHDHKRGEDVRARLAVLTETPARWVRWARDWVADAGAATRVHPADRYQLAQTLVGAWPDGLAPDDAAALEPWFERVLQWWTKALREAKLRTSWTDPDSDYESACADLLRSMAPGAPLAPLLQRAADLARDIAPAGRVNGLAQTLLRLTTPGVPDLYQGTDLWDLSLVDPDNRRPVDFALRAALLERPLPPGRIAPQAWADGSVKLHLLRAALASRQERPDVYALGGYTPLAVQGPAAAHVVAFLREHAGRAVLVAVPRGCARRLAGLQDAKAARLLRDTRIALPAAWAGAPWTDALADGAPAMASDGDGIALATLWQARPVSLLHAG
ncbi:malto-oligosyltrehalose synthase [Bordetella genomosp. 1]|uniref:Malto-oligosyltrehalose synthase n=1 Tax=Bordetella genomosp. 1 TaxID=1395607 RepID=A0ABX4EXG8_9BORD|nr:malto-oligosyltrehalose synthase [Bordetella genomosp. 1]OZI63782.1 malto-oligosyltrehalose synthase [Bordetella genomosp. 1]